MHQSARHRTSFWKTTGAAGLGAFLVTGMLATGPAAVDCMYGDLFHEAGWMLQFAAAGAWFQMLEGTVGASLFALGRSRSVTVGNASRLLGVLLFVPAGYWLGRRAGLAGPLDGGFVGMLLGFFAADFLRYRWCGWPGRRAAAPCCDVIIAAHPRPQSGSGFRGALLANMTVHIRTPRLHSLYSLPRALLVLAWGLLGVMYRKVWACANRWFARRRSRLIRRN